MKSESVGRCGHLSRERRSVVFSGDGLPVGRLLRYEESGGEGIVNLYAAESIEGRISLLALRKCFGFPVCEALPFRDASAEENSVNSRERVVGDIKLFYVRL